jgi:5-methylcytosine-specific restriction endonuclease McrA
MSLHKPSFRAGLEAAAKLIESMVELGPVRGLIARDVLCVKPSIPSTKASKFRTSQRKQKQNTKAEKNAETAEIRRLVFDRDARCRMCEGTGLTLDHFWGRGKVLQAVENCWALCHRCHRDKTNGFPDRVFWLRLYRDHVQSWAEDLARDPDDQRANLYAAEYAKATREIEAEEAKAALPHNPTRRSVETFPVLKPAEGR